MAYDEQYEPALPYSAASNVAKATCLVILLIMLAIYLVADSSIVTGGGDAARLNMATAFWPARIGLFLAVAYMASHHVASLRGMALFALGFSVIYVLLAYGMPAVLPGAALVSRGGYSLLGALGSFCRFCASALTYLCLLVMIDQYEPGYASSALAGALALGFFGDFAQLVVPVRSTALMRPVALVCVPATCVVVERVLGLGLGQGERPLGAWTSSSMAIAPDEWALVLGGSVVFPLVYALFRSFGTSGPYGFDLGECLGELVGATLLVVYAMLVLVLRKRPRTGASLGAILSVYLAVLVLMAILDSDYYAVLMVPLGVGYVVFCAYLWIYVARRCRGSVEAAFVWFGVCNALLFFSLHVGDEAGYLLSLHAYGDAPLLGSMALVAIGVLLLAATALLLAARRFARRIALDAPGQMVVSVEPARHDDVPTPAVADDYARRCDGFAREYGLTPREREVMGEFARGHTVESIARQLFISPNTVRMHVRRLYGKADVHSRQELIDRIEAMTCGDDGQMRGAGATHE